jgi:transcription antitermination factor NusG
MHDKLLPKWHVVYTMPNNERKVVSRITDMGIESYLPLQKVIRQWRDRKKKLEVPLFPNYVFVKVDEPRRGSLMSIRELVGFVSIGKKPVVVKEEEILAIQHATNQDLRVVPEEKFCEGKKVRIGYGQFSGLEGTIVQKNGNTRLIITIEGLGRAFSFNICSSIAEAVVFVQ